MLNLKSTNRGPITKWSDYKLDPRYPLLLFLITFAVAGQVYLGFFQRWDAIFTSLVCTVGTELVLVRLLHKKWVFPLSAVITGIGVSLLLSSYLLWPYALASVLSIVLKFLIRYKGSHIFNPNNVSLVLVLFFLPDFAVSTPKQWTNGYEVMIFILCLGMIVSYLANRHDTVIAFLSGFTLFALGRHYFFDTPLWFALGPLLGASLQLFTFFMITDPKTTPNSRPARVVFAILIALFDAILRLFDVNNQQFYAVFLLAVFVGIPYRWWMSRKFAQMAEQQTG
ncbi:RnfABCDGE type electron transport complex subunit D [Brevibacillus humidisoli]|uniref:RnfABCDGE type electron transport complex subunit D n=1 Tax=Brevibacillus humidisoli TaxID=2895522 RepID=UPI001E505C00|nr:RnfABCDGE type electron transport complex subunit D [Brevibacillus humidisoli]UFJ42428.1 RnfABCDGE type electron transport complex subunit D [Brevibacillus humidisoli]